MKTSKKYQFLFAFAVAFFTTAVAVSQNMMQEEPNQDLREAAREAVEYWENELSLTAKQADLMERKIIEFAIKKDRILNSKMREEVKTKYLKQYQVLEYKDMRDILTKPQHERYIALSRRRIRSQDQIR